MYNQLNVQDHNLVLATSIKERIRLLKSIYKGDEMDCVHGLLKWRERKSIVRKDKFDLMLFANGISEDEFAIGVKKLNQSDIDLLYTYLKGELWYQRHRRILNKVESTKGVIKDGFKYFSRPYTRWLKVQVRSILRNSSITAHDEVINEFVGAFHHEVMDIALKTIVYDMNEIGEDKPVDEQGMLQYAKDRFLNIESYDKFFNDYPVLARLLSVRIDYAVKNFQEFIKALELSAEECRKTFDIQGALVLQKISLNKGDSHSEGKSVIMFTMNDKPLVFKYKNLEIGNSLNQFYGFIEQFDQSFSFYKIKRVIAPKYTIEECLYHRPCESKEDVQRYYERFGYLVCIAYILCGNDFHLENLIAVGDQPVLIDVETFIQNTVVLKDKGTAIYEFTRRNNESISGTCLLPTNIGDKSGDKGVETSALSGGEQVLPYQVLQLKEDDMGRLTLEYQDYTMKGADNIPILNGEKISHIDYVIDVIHGFKRMYEVIENNLAAFAQRIQTLFSGQSVRNVLKSTQKYADMLNYGYHPSCMTNYINRERLFENIWAYPYDNPSIIKYEFEDLLNNDIPIFYNVVNQRGIITSSEDLLENYYSKTAMAHVEDRLKRLSEKDLREQINIMQLALGTYKGELTVFEMSGSKTDSSDNLGKARKITDYICDKVVWGSGRGDIILPMYMTDADGNWKQNVMSLGYYDGLSGIYILLNQMISYDPRKDYLEILHVLDGMFFEKIDEIKNIDQYTNYLSLLYTICHKIRRINNIKDIFTGTLILEKIITFYNQNKLSDEWLYGKSSLIKVCLVFYQITGIEKGLQFAEKVAGDIKVAEMNQIGFAHGYSGVLYSLLCLAEYVEPNKNEWLIEKINHYHQMFLEHSKVHNEKSLSWCNGLVGIGFTQIKLFRLKEQLGWRDYVIDEDLIEKILSMCAENDCLCHGNFGTVSFLKELQDCVDDNSLIKKRIDFKLKQLLAASAYSIRGLAGEPSLDMMTGICGIAYGLLRLEDTTIPNILLLD